MHTASYALFNINFGVIVLDDGQVLTTTAALSAALGINEQTLLKNYHQHKHRFIGLSITDSNTKGEALNLIRSNRASFHSKRIRNDMHLWCEEDIYTHCWLSNSPRAVEFMQYTARHLREWRQKNIPLNYQQQINTLQEAVSLLQAQFQQVIDERDHYKKQFELSGSYHGAGLQLHTKRGPLVN
jgi:hypothetical protein